MLIMHNSKIKEFQWAYMLIHIYYHTNSVKATFTFQIILV